MAGGGSRGEQPARVDALDRVSDGIFVLDGEFRFTYLNRRAEEFLAPAEELLGERIWDAFPATVDTAVEEQFRAAMEAREPQSFGGHSPRLGGWFDVRVYPDEEGGGLIVYLTDVTERTESRRELERTNRQLSTLIESLSVAVYLKDRDGTYRLANEAAADLFGLDPGEMVGRDDEELFGGEDAAEICERDRRIMESGESESRETVRRIDREEYVFLSEKHPYRDEDGEVAGIVGISRDITDRVERESRLRRKNDRLEEFADIVSHDLRNPLNVAQGRAALLEEECDSDHLPPVFEALDRMEAIVEDTLTLARQGETVADPEWIRATDLVGECWRMIDSGDARIEIADEFALRGDRDRLRHVFENLFRNSVEHGSTGPRNGGDAVEHGSTSPRETGDAVEHGSTSPRETGDAVEHGSTSPRSGAPEDGSRDRREDGEGVTVRVGALDGGFYVEDDGPGIPPGDREEVVEHGYTTAEGGTGFGLTIVERIVEAHGWEIRVAEGSDGGARFEVTGVDVDPGARSD